MSSEKWQRKGKQMRTTAHLALPGLVMAMAVSGCTTFIKEGAGAAMGAKGAYMPIQPIGSTKADRPLAVYQRFELGKITDDIGGKTPPSLLEHLPGAFAEEIGKAKLPNQTDGKTMLIRGVIIHYESASTLGAAIGPLEEVVVRTEFVDKDSGKVLGTGNCIGRTTNRVNLGVKKKAEGLARAFVKWIKARYPEPEPEPEPKPE